MMADDNEIDFDPRIDEQALDLEWLRQPKLYFKWASAYAAAKRDVSEAKAELDVTKAEVAAEIRKDPGFYGCKGTVDAVNECAMLQPEYKAALRKLHRMQYHQDVIGAAVSSLDHRKKALENLVDLHSQNYFSEPRAKPASREAVDNMERDAVRRRGQRRHEQDTNTESEES